MSYVLATTTTVVRWYRFDVRNAEPGEFELMDRLDLSVIPCFSDRKTLAAAAKALGLKTWRTVKLP